MTLPGRLWRGLLLAVFCALLLPSASLASPAPKFVWPFSDGSGQPQGGISTSWSGSLSPLYPGGVYDDNAGGALFSGSVYGSTSFPAPGSRFSFSGWVKPSASTTNSFILSSGSLSSGYHLFITPAGRLRFQLGGGYVESAPLPDSWSFFTAAYDGSRVYLFLSGVEFSAIPPILPTYPSSTLRLGRFSGSPQQRFIGGLDQLSFFDSPLSLSDHLEMYEKGMGPSPRLSLISAPSGLISAAAGGLQFEVSPGDGAECSLDGAPFSPCSSPASLPGLTDGSHQVSLRAYDRWGRKSEVAGSSFIVDSSMPRTLLAAISLPGYEQGARITALSEPGASFECSLDGGGFSSCPSSGPDLTSLPDGRHRLSVRAVDQAGNRDPSPPAVWLQLDRSKLFSASVTPYLSAAASSRVTPECRIGSGDWQPCTNTSLPSRTSLSVRLGELGGEMETPEISHPLLPGALEVQNIVSASSRNTRGEIQGKPYLRLLMASPQEVRFQLSQGSKSIASWSEQLPAGSSLRFLPGEIISRLAPGSYLLTAFAGQESESAYFSKTSTRKAKSGSIMADVMRGSDRPDLLRGDTGGDRIWGFTGPDVLWGDTAPDKLWGGAGDDTLDGGSGGDRLYGEEGRDTVFGGYGLDTIYGGPGDDSLDGANAEDKVYGDDGNDVLHGGGGSDLLSGGAGDDRIYPDSSADRVEAGPGEDIVYYNTGQSPGPVSCGPGDDTLILSRYGKDASGKSLPGGWSAKQLVDNGEVSDCEHLIWADAQGRDPRLGVTILTGDEGAPPWAGI